MAILGSDILHKHRVTGQDQVEAANDGVESSFERMQSSMMASAGGMVIVANQAFELASKLGGLASKLGEVAKAGAASKDIGRTFAALGDAVPRLQELQAAVAKTVDATTLQGFATMGDKMELTAEQSTGLAQRLTVLASEQGKLAELSDILGQAQESPKEAFKKLGVIIDDTEAQYVGLSEAQKNLLIIQEQSRLGTQEQVDALESSQAVVLGLETQFDDLASSAQQAFFEFLEGSGILDTIGEAITGVTKWFSENQATVEKLGNAVASIFNAAMTIAGKLIEGVADKLAMLAPAIEFTAAAIEKIASVISVDFGDAVESAFITDIPFASEETGKLSTELERLTLKLKLAKQELEDSQEVREEEQDLVTRAFAVEREIAALRLENADALSAAMTVIAREGSPEKALNKLAEQRETLENIVDLTKKQTSLEREYGQVTLATRATTDLVAIDAIISEIVTKSRDEIEAEKSKKEAVKETAKAEKDREAAMRKAEEARRKHREEERKFQEELAGAIWESRISRATELYMEQYDAIVMRNGALEWYRQLTEETLPVLQESFAVEMQRAANDAQAAEKLDIINAQIAERDAALRSMGDATAMAGEAFAGWGQQATVWSTQLVTMGKAISTSTKGSEQFEAALSAGKAITAGAVEDKTTLAALGVLWEGAEAAAAFATGNPVAGGEHLFAASLYAATAAFTGGGGGGGGGAGRAPSPAASRPSASTSGFGTAFDRGPTTEAQGGGGTTVILQFTDVTGTAANRMADVLNSGARSGSGIRLDKELLEGLGA